MPRRPKTKASKLSESQTFKTLDPVEVRALFRCGLPVTTESLMSKFGISRTQAAWMMV